MKKILILGIFLLAIINTRAQDIHDGIDTSIHSMEPATVLAAKKIASDFMSELLAGGNVDSLLLYCAIPIAIDGKVIKSRDELRTMLGKITGETKHARSKARIDSTMIFGKRQQLLNELIPLDIYFVICRIRFDIKDQISTKQIVVAVRREEKWEIVEINGE